MEDWRTKIAASLLAEEPFEPVFPVEDKWIRLESFNIQQVRARRSFDSSRLLRRTQLTDSAASA